MVINQINLLIPVYPGREGYPYRARWSVAGILATWNRQSRQSQSHQPERKTGVAFFIHIDLSLELIVAQKLQ